MRVLMVTGRLPTSERPGSLAPVARQIASIRREGATVAILELSGFRMLKYLLAIPRLRRMAKDVDIVHAHFGYSGWLALCQRKRPVVISYMGNDLLGRTLADGRLSLVSRLAVQVNRFIAGRAAAVIVKSEEMAKIVGHVPAHVVPNGVDMEEFAPEPPSVARGRLGWSTDVPIALFAGCPDFPNKGYSIAQRACEVASERLGQTVELKVLWNVPPETVPVYMSASDAMILASQTEGSPNVVKEALACELPVVATAVGDVIEVVGSVRGCAIRDREPIALGIALADALRSGRLQEGRATLAAKGLDQSSVARRVLAIYDDAVAASGRSHVA